MYALPFVSTAVILHSGFSDDDNSESLEKQKIYSSKLWLSVCCSRGGRLGFEGLEWDSNEEERELKIDEVLYQLELWSNFCNRTG